MPLQGTVIIPRLIKTLPSDWGSIERPHQSLLLEGVGSSLAERKTELTESDYEPIFTLYERLHEQGYIHNDVASRNETVRRLPSSSALEFRLIDFGRAHRPSQSESWMFENEMDQVEYMIYKLLNPDEDGHVNWLDL